jgi:beta-lactamase family protein
VQITFIGHAAILIETHGIRVLSDPWWSGPCFGAQWWTCPLPDTKPVAGHVDYIYISHGHHDHLHPGTLRTLNRDAVCLISSRGGLAATVRDLGFQVIELDDDSVHALAPGVQCRIVGTQADDTLFAIDDGERVCVNLNDALHAAPAPVQDRFIAQLSAWYPTIDYLFCGYGVASHFPNCYVIPGKDRDATAAKRQAYFNRQWVRIVAGLSPRMAFPFAADVVLLEDDLIWVNEPTSNSERPTDVFEASHPGSSTTVVDMAPGFSVSGDSIVRKVLRTPISIQRLRAERKSEIERANNYGASTIDTFDAVLGLVKANVELCGPYLREYRGDYSFILCFRNLAAGIAVMKRGQGIEVTRCEDSATEPFDLSFTTRLHYLRWSLTTPYGHEILFVGSGGIFKYRDAEDVCRSMHRELMTMLMPHKESPASRFGTSSPFVSGLKRTVKSLLGRRPSDLYDLGAWTVWSTEDIGASRRA